LEKVMNQKSNMHVDGKSDGRVLPTKCSNKSGNPLAEGMEGRRPAKEKTVTGFANVEEDYADNAVWSPGAASRFSA